MEEGSSLDPQSSGQSNFDLSLREEAERVFKHLAIDRVVKNHPEYDISKSYGLENSCVEPLSLMTSIQSDVLFPTYLQPILCPNTGQIITYEERWNSSIDEERSSHNSLSIRRTPDARSFNKLLGDSNNFPFLPAGFDDEIEQILRFSEKEKTTSLDYKEETKYLLFEKILCTPTGFSNCIDLTSFVNFYNCDKEESADGENYSIETETLVGKLDNEFDSLDIKHLNDNLRQKQAVILPSDNTKSVDESLPQQIDESVNIEEIIYIPPVSTIENIPPLIETNKLIKKADATYAYAQVLDISKKVNKYDESRETMAKKYPFELDPFQQQAVVCMEEGSSVFVAAHTSAGKTVVAEYAVALCKLHRTRVIYTSPIKALSNQKYREFKIMFADVGLITGDIQLNSEAFCLIMTTEILRSMLYNGSEVIRELEWVIFDEVHYINDIERGHVWEEVLIMLPSHVKIVMLSATVPNCMEFADWVGRIKNRKINVIQTLKRPVPLEHFIYCGQDGKTKKDLFLIFDSKGNFLNSGYQKAVEAKNKKAEKLAKVAGRGAHGGGAGANQPMGRGGHGGANQQMRRGGRGGAGANQPMRPSSVSQWQINKNSKNIYINLIDYLQSQDLLPMVGFIFSRQRCDEMAKLLESVDLTTAQEKSSIRHFFTKCIERLKGSDKKLPQVLLMQEHCKRGFAVHHSGILPIIKEVVELLFQRGLVKILFATETFAMGVNMPARSVIFDSIEKYDGNQKRLLNATEYVQMAGRAGRRGLDKIGTVIILAKGPDPPDIASLKSILQGKPIKLESRFRLTYGMMLNLLRVEHEQLRIEDLLQRSYWERASLRLVVSRKEMLKKIEEDIEALQSVECSLCYPSEKDGDLPSLPTCFDLISNYYEELTNVWSLLISRCRQDKLFAMGRIVVINYAQLGFVGRLAVVLKSQLKENNFLLTLFVPTTSKMENDKDKQTQEAKEDQRWRRLTLVAGHAIVNGIEFVERVQTFTKNACFTILEDVGLDCLNCVCKRSISKIDYEAIMEEFKRISGPYRQQSPDRSVRKLLMELDAFSEKFCEYQRDNRPNSELVYVLGQDIEQKEVELVDRLKYLNQLRTRLLDKDNFPCTYCPQNREHLEELIQRRKLEEKKSQLTFQTSSDGLTMSQENADRIKVLQTLNYIDKQNMVGLKGKVACEISNQELLITELILENKFDKRTPAEIAAMLSLLTCQFEPRSTRSRDANFSGEQEKLMEGQPPLERVPREFLRELEEEVLQVAERIDSVQKACRVVTSPVIEQLKLGLVEVVHQWASGMEFSQIMRLTDAQEGIIVRCIQRLDEVCKDVRKAARIIGDPALFEKMEETSAAIRRDIVFAASLYTTE